MSSFVKDTIQTFCAATLGSMTSALLTRGTAGASGAADLVNLALDGLQTGVDFVAYPIALNLIGKVSVPFKKNMENPKGKQYITWVVGGAATAVLGTLMKYPIQKVQEARKGGKVTICPKEILSNSIDSLGGSIGFPTTNGLISPLFPAQKGAFAQWAQGHLIVHLSNLGATLMGFPIAHLRHGAKLGDAICGWKNGIPGTMYTNDACAHFKALMQ